jgi:2'-5' RNA ligase
MEKPAMTDHRDHHLTIFLPAHVSGPIEAGRREWDPEMASQIAAHVTLVYPQEACDPGLLLSRLRSVATGVAPFRLRLETLACFGRPEDGVYVAIEDCDQGFMNLRGQLLKPPFKLISFPPHVTLVHPRTSTRGREFWETHAFEPSNDVFTVDQIAMTAFDDTSWVTIDTVWLGGAIDRCSGGRGEVRVRHEDA